MFDDDQKPGAQHERRRQERQEEDFWKGVFGDEYTARNIGATIGSVQSNVALFTRALQRAPEILSVIEFGAGAGNNLKAINQVLPFAELSAVEINERAIEQMPECVTTIIHGSALDTPRIKAQDLALTKGLLIHIAPDDLARAYDVLYQASRRYVMVCEYFSPKPRMIPYRGHDDRLWARDFAGEILDRFPDLKLIDYGFVYDRDPFPQDNITWFLMEKSQ